MPMLNMSQNRTALAKLILMGVGVAMVFASLGFWSLALSGRQQVADALLAATRVQPVQFTPEDALKARERLEKLTPTVGAAAGPSDPRMQASMASGQPVPPPPSQPMIPGFNRGPLSEAFAMLLEQRPLFGAAPRPGPPSANVQGILGDQALINGEWVQVGSDRGGIKLVATQTDKVTVEIAGQRQDVSVWQSLPNNPMPPSPQQMMGQGGGMPNGGSPGGDAASARERAIMMQQQQRRSGAAGMPAGNSLSQRTRGYSSGNSLNQERTLERGVEMMPSGGGSRMRQETGYSTQGPGGQGVSSVIDESPGTRNTVRTTRRSQNMNSGVAYGNSSVTPAKTPRPARTPNVSTGSTGSSRTSVKKATRKSRSGVSSSGGAQSYQGVESYSAPPDQSFGSPPGRMGDPSRSGMRE